MCEHVTNLSQIFSIYLLCRGWENLMRSWCAGWCHQNRWFTLHSVL